MKSFISGLILFLGIATIPSATAALVHDQKIDLPSAQGVSNADVTVTVARGIKV